MPHDDEDRVFDVSKPHKVSPSANSRPVIVGHHPMMSDPMVTDNRPTEPSHAAEPSLATHVPVSFDTEDPSEHKTVEVHTASEPTAEPTAVAAPSSTKESFFMPVAPPEEVKPPEPPEPEAGHPAAPEIYPHQGPLVPSTVVPTAPDSLSMPAEPQASSPLSDLPLPTHHGNKSPHVKSGNHKMKLPRVLMVLVILAIAYMLLDAMTSVSLPFYIFRKTTPAVQPAAAIPPASTSSTTAAGLKTYSLSTTGVSFAYPTTWGVPTAVTDPGFSKRGGTNASDGTYAYLISFATNKDVQLAFTSSKYLPTTRTALYYDFLQWCVGTNDGKYYDSTLHFATASAVDTPTTLTCDQGPLSSVTKLDANTLVQLNTVAADGTALGDLYTKNLTDTNLPVVRVKDAAMSNSSPIKSLLGSIKIAASSTSSNSTQ